MAWARAGDHGAGWGGILGAGGGRSRATMSDSNPHVLCVESQNGLVFDWPQRHSVTRVRPASPKTRPSWSTISKSPSTRSEPLFMTVMRAGGMEVSDVGRSAEDRSV